MALNTVQTVVVTVAVGSVAIAGYKYIQRKRAEARLKKVINGFADEMEKVFGGPEFAGSGFNADFFRC